MMAFGPRFGSYHFWQADSIKHIKMAILVASGENLNNLFQNTKSLPTLPPSSLHPPCASLSHPGNQ